MARKLRIEYPGAIYHLINRGNYRRDLFESVGAGDAFLKTLFEAAARYRWRVHAYVLMRNHYHVALETPEPNLVVGMHWLQSTIATRFNRFRKESGHLFQGRYQSLVVEDMAVLSRLVDYIHLNPVRAKIVLPEQVKAYRWSSLGRFLKGPRDATMTAIDWLAARGGWTDSPEGWRDYETYLIELGTDQARWERDGVVGLSEGWAIGSSGWRRAMAQEHAALALNPGLEKAEAQALREASWMETAERLLKASRHVEADLAVRPMKQAWKLDLAQQVRDETGAPITWLAQRFNLGKPESLRSYLHHRSRNQQNTALYIADEGLVAAAENGPQVRRRQPQATRASGPLPESDRKGLET